MHLAFQSIRTCLLATILGLSFSACNKQEVSPVEAPLTETARVPVEENCTVSFNAAGGTSYGTVPKLAPASGSWGTARYAGQSDCDYFVGFPANSYRFVIAASLDDPEVATQIRRLITDAPNVVFGQVVGGGFGNSLGIGTRSGDTRRYVILGATRTNNYLSGLASSRGTTVQSLLGKHLRMAD